jgi:pimeloyl-ACP methyl ester carboxylesterase
MGAETRLLFVYNPEWLAPDTVVKVNFHIFGESSFMRFVSLVLCLFPIYLSAQIRYGNNPAAGHYCNTRGVRIYYETYGRGDPLVLAHGNGGSIESMKSIIPFFSKYYKVIAVDTRAHGKSVDRADSLTFEMIADDFNALLDSLHTGPVYFIGWSDGGIDGVAIAMRHREKLKKMAITGTNIFVDSTALPPDFFQHAEETTKRLHARSNLTDKEKAALKYNDLDLYQPQWKATDLDNITTPTLVIGGDHDAIPVPHTVLIWQHIPHAWLWIVPHSGHATLIEHKDDFEKTVLRFFRSE